MINSRPSLNFLAHLYLSGDDEEIIIGNFIADFVKGNSKNSYQPGIRHGIELHRAIDDFTDHHAITSISKHRIYPTQGKYAPVVIDMFYDHFLAKDFERFSNESLGYYAKRMYQLLERNSHVLPDRVKAFLPHMIEHNWLCKYSSVEGISRTLKGLGKRVAFANHMHEAGQDLINSYQAFEEDFGVFFPELITFVAAKR